MADTTLERFIDQGPPNDTRCKHIVGGYCPLKARNGFCHRHLMLCGDDSIKPMDQFTKFKLNKKKEVEIKK